MDRSVCDGGVSAPGSGDELPSPHHRILVARLLLALLASAIFAVALVPFYDVICRATGLNGRTADGNFALGGYAGTGRIGTVSQDRLVTVQFTGTVMPGLQWEMKPLTDSVTLHPGELRTVKFLVRNRGPFRVEGQAVPSVAPGQAGRYFQKVECFCFAHQPMRPGEEREMPVTFTVRSDLDPEVSLITLSYAFFPVAGIRRTALTPELPASRPGSRPGIRS